MDNVSTGIAINPEIFLVAISVISVNVLKPVFLGDGATAFAFAFALWRFCCQVAEIDLNITAPEAFSWCLRVWKQLLPSSSSSSSSSAAVNSVLPIAIFII